MKMNVIKRLSASYLRKSKMMPKEKRCQSSRRPIAPLGSRILTDPTKVFEHNMWDHMQWTQEEEEGAREKATENSFVRVDPEDQDKYEREASKYWNEFYKIHKNNFFKDRNWLFLEFPEILPKGRKDQTNTEEKFWDYVKLNATNNCTNMSFPRMFEVGKDYCQNNLVDDLTSIQGLAYNKNQAEPVADNKHIKNCEQEPVKQESFPGSGATYRILEVGCGAGNSAFPILKVICDTPGAFLYCCDFASEAVELVKSHLSYNSAWCSAFVHDVCDDALPYPFPDEILDVILLVFVLSAIHPDRMQAVVNRLATLLKPGGMLLFRDYGRYDTSQLRFKKVTVCQRIFMYEETEPEFISLQKVHNMFTQAGLIEVQNLVDRRLQVNRKKKVKMQRVWIQGKFQKPFQQPQNSHQ